MSVRKYRRGDRGFYSYGRPLQTCYGDIVEVYESSSAEGPHVWLSVKGNVVGVAMSPVTLCAHLDVKMAKDMVARLRAWIDDNTPRR